MLGFTSTWKSHLKTRDEFSRFPGWVDIAPTLYKFHLLVCGSHCGTVALTIVTSPAAPRNRGHHSSEHGPCRWDCCKERWLLHPVFFSTNLLQGNRPQLRNSGCWSSTPLRLLRSFPDVQMRNAYFTAAAL